MGKTYECKICNYITSDKSNHSRHTKSNRHKKKVVEAEQLIKEDNLISPPNLPKSSQISQNISNSTKNDDYLCMFCGMKCTRSSSLWKHQNTCSGRKVNELNNIIKIKDNNINNLKYHVNELKEDLEYYKNLVKNAGVGNGTKITNNVQSLIVSKHEDAPAIEYAKPNLLKFNSKDAHENSLFLVNRYKDNTFTMFVGKCIVAACKKEDPDEQSIWATDANRLTMFIKKVMDNDSKWISDKKGVQTTKYLISPILQKIKEMLIDYNKHLYSQISKLPQYEVDYYNDIMINCRELVHFIEHDKLADEILRYMAPRLTYEIK